MLYASAPLISFMIDQQSNFSPLGLKTEFVGEAESRKDLEKEGDGRRSAANLH